MEDQGRERQSRKAGKDSRKKATMANDDSEAPAVPHEPTNDASGGRPRPPAWAKDLRALYDSVVEETLPDSFMDLLSKLDQDPE